MTRKFARRATWRRVARAVAPAFGCLVLSFAMLARAQEGTDDTEAPAPAAIPPERLRDDLMQGANLFRRNPDPTAARDYAAREAYVDVRYDGRTLSVRDPWLTDQVAGLDDDLSPEDRRAKLDAIADHLAARAAEVDARIQAASAAKHPKATPTPPADPEKVLRSVLDQRQFHTPTEDPKLAQAAAKVRDTIRAGWQKVKDFAQRLFEPSDQPQTLGDRLRTWGAILLAIAATGVAIFFVVRAILRATVDDAERPEDEELPDAPPRPEVMEAQAEAAAARGDRRAAVRALYLALLGDLHAQGAIEYDRHRTNREYLRTMRLIAGRADAFGSAVELFDRKWYGKEPCSPAELDLFRALVVRARTAEAIAA